MSIPPTIPPPPDDQYEKSPRSRMAGFINGITGGGNARLNEIMAEDHARKMADLGMHRDAAHQYSQVLLSGISPATGKPLTEEETKDYTLRQQTAQKQYEKVAGINPEAKDILEKLGTVVGHVMGKGKKGGDGGGQGGGTPSAGGAGGGPPPSIPPPPGGAGASATPAVPPAPPAGSTPPFIPLGTASASSAKQGPELAQAGTPPAPPPTQQAATAPPTALPPPALSPLAVSQGAPIVGAQLGQQMELAKQKQSEQQQAEVGLASERAKRLQEPELAAKELDAVAPNMPPEQKQNLLVRKLGYVPPPKMVTKIMSDPDSPTGASQVSYDQLTGTVYSRQQGAFLPRGYVPTERIMRDPYGNVSVSATTPMAPGVVAGAGTIRSGESMVKGSGSAKATNAGAGTGGLQRTAAPPPLDPEGHIAGVPRGYTPQSVEGANQLLDGQDVTKLPAPSRALSSKLARNYGWEQGKFTPKEQTQIREASTFIQDALKDGNALSALDAGLLDRAQLSQVTANPDKEGFIGRTMTSAASQNMDDKQTAFVQMYNQLVGTIAGLSKLVRPGGTTEAQIERLKSELPNPVTTKNSADARARLIRLQKEIDIAQAKGSFGQLGTATTTPAKPAPKAGGRPAAIAPPQGAPSDIDAAIMQAVQKAKGGTSGQPRVH